MKNYHMWPEISTCLKEVEEEKKKLTKGTINLDTLTSTRETISHLIEQIQVSLEQDMDKQSASLAVFALVAFVDERMQTHILELGQGSWAPLQKDFYGAYNAGELFYETIDKIIDDPKTPPIIPEIFYFILKKGFKGKYRDSKTYLTKYIDILKEKIAVAPVSKESIPVEPSISKLRKKIKTWHYYAGASLATLSLLMLLYFTSSV